MWQRFGRCRCVVRNVFAVGMFSGAAEVAILVGSEVEVMGTELVRIQRWRCVQGWPSG